MCNLCDYQKILDKADLEATDNRMRVLEAVGGNDFPLTATDIYAIVERDRNINRVTVYRILDLLVERRILDKISVTGRAAFYGMAPNENHAPHPHFYCTRCGRLDCLRSESVAVNTEQLEKNFPGAIERVEVRIDGICRNCLKLSSV